MWVGLLTDRINNKLEKGNLINEHALNREPVPLKHNEKCWHARRTEETLNKQLPSEHRTSGSRKTRQVKYTDVVPWAVGRQSQGS